MEVKPAYKQTEVGVVPDEWDVKAFGRIYAEPSRNGIYKSAEYKGRGTRIVNMGEMFGLDFISDQEMSRVSLTPKELATFSLRDGDLLFGRRSIVPEGAGKCAMIVDPREPMTFESSVIRVRINETAANPLFLYYFFASSVGRATMNIIVSGTNVKGIRGTELRDLRIPQPPLPEQRAIAGTLSEADELLVRLDRLIAKKRDLKQAAMQQLLTGRTRLPGFSGDWENLPACKIGAFRGGTGFPLEAQGESSGAYPFYKVSDMNNEGNETFMTAANHWISEQIRKHLGATVFPKDSIVFAKVGAAIFLERKKILGQSSCIDNNMMAFVLDKSRVDVRFVHTLLLNKKLGSLVATTALPALNGRQLGELVLAVPSLAEQTAIATVLSDMDAELAAFEQRREKTRALKQAMMQELLTGKTRLV